MRFRLVNIRNSFQVKKKTAFVSLNRTSTKQFLATFLCFLTICPQNKKFHSFSSREISSDHISRFLIQRCFGHRSVRSYHSNLSWAFVAFYCKIHEKWSRDASTGLQKTWLFSEAQKSRPIGKIFLSFNHPKVSVICKNWFSIIRCPTKVVPRRRH